MPSAFVRRVAGTIRSRGLWGPGARVAVAVSGGPDSVALLFALADLARRAPWSLAGLIHVNHGLRPDAPDDTEFCRALACRLNIPFDTSRVDVRQTMAEENLSLEAAARIERYAALGRGAGRLSATLVATGHTCDDQAETLLLRLLRGTSFRGAAGIRPRRGIFVRPLLDVRRADARTYLASLGETYREDPSNADETIPRNRLRRVLLPVVEDLWPGGVSALARFAELAAEDERWLSMLARREGRSRVRTVIGGVELSTAGLEAYPLAVARRIVRDALEQAGGHPTFRDVDAILGIASSPRGRAMLDLRGVSVEKRRSSLSILRTGFRPEAARVSFSHRLEVPGLVEIGETGSTIRSSLSYEGQNGFPPRSAGPVVALQASRLMLPLTVRSRRPGDRLRPLGGPGERKLQDLLVDRKIPLADRDFLPIVVDGEGRIVWVAGVTLADQVRVTAPEDGMVILEFKKDGQ